MSGGEEAKTIKMTPDQQAKAEKDFKKQQAVNLAEYKKRLREGNDLKKLQVEELEFNIRYYKAKREWFDLREDMEKLESEEQAILAEEKARHQEMERLQAEALEKAKTKPKAAKKPAPKAAPKSKIIVPEQGSARPK